MSTAVLDTKSVPTAPPAFRWAPLLVVLAGTLVTFLDFFIVNVALDAIGADLHTGPDAVQLVVAGYGVAFAALMITGGRLGDLYGRRRLFSIGLAAFTVASLACGLAPGAGSLIVARVAQGAAGALLTPQVLAILGTVYTGRDRARAFAGYGFAMGIAAVLGQVLGGVLIAADVAGTGWRAIFLVNLPVGLVVLPLVRRYVPESRGPRTELDVLGTVLVTAALIAVVLPLVEGRAHGWPLWTWLSLAAAPVLLAGFVGQERRRVAAGRAPLVDLRLFAERGFGVGSLVGLAFGGVPAAFFFVLALYLQQGRGYSPAFSGLVFTAVGAGYFLALTQAGRIAARVGRQGLALGAVVVAAGMLALDAGTGATSALDLTPGLAVIGFGIGLVLVPLAQTVLTGVDPAQAGAASGVLVTAQQVGGALGVSVIGSVFFAAVPGGTTHAFAVALAVLAGVTLVTVALVQALPRR